MKKNYFKNIGSACLAALLTASMLFASACSDNSESTNAPWTTEAPETIPWTTDDIESNIVYEDTEPVEDVTDTFETNTPETDAPETLVGPGYELSDGTLTILDDDAMEDYVVSQEIPWYGQRESITKVIISDGVTRIASLAFSQCSNLESITIPDSVKSIEESAFYECTSLESIVLPDSVTSIGEGAFYASGLKSFEIPNGITTIKRRTFRNCPNLESIEIPSSVKSIEEEVFWNCESLKELKIPGSVTEFDTSAIIWCVSLEAITVDENNKNFSSVDGVLFNKDKTVLLSHPQGSKRTEYTVPDSVQAIDKCAFRLCENLKGVEIPASVKSLSFPVFYNCENLETVTVDENNKYFSSIDGVLFNKDKTVLIYYPQGSKRTEYTVPDCVKTIGEAAFDDSLLKSVIISDGVTDIGSFAFEWCESLEHIEIPTSVKSISYAVFSKCNSLKEINFKGTKAQWEAIEKDEVWDLYMPEYTVNFGA